MTSAFSSLMQCKFYARGDCRNGDQCPFVHTTEPETKDSPQSHTKIASFTSNPYKYYAQAQSRPVNTNHNTLAQFADQSRWKWVSPKLKQTNEAKKKPSSDISEIHDDKKLSVEVNSSNHDVVSNEVEAGNISITEIYMGIKNRSAAEISSKEFEEFLQHNDYDYNFDDESHYSNIKDLSAEQIKQFEADHFDYGQVPVVPPPKEFC
ncbi:unnamed protein product [Thelazia callipaeda]|uniref:Nucleoporin NUP42 n=1 Tax=Thelazia callipaeda TaxID=103827 RepID=A0A0N5D0S5_THECL|nr:unnamed protein product [Thelazia callipaeda]